MVTHSRVHAGSSPVSTDRFTWIAKIVSLGLQSALVLGSGLGLGLGYLAHAEICKLDLPFTGNQEIEALDILQC